MKLKMYYELTISRKQLEERTFKDNLLYMVIYVMVDLSSWKRYRLTSEPIIISDHLFTGFFKKQDYFTGIFSQSSKQLQIPTNWHKN